MSTDSSVITDTRPYRLSRLDQLVRAWLVATESPPLASHLPTDELAALTLASGHDLVGERSLDAFLALDGWFRRWVLEQRGLGRYIGSVVGED
jgi:hypothetical protein